jgi:hypothetical protein
LRWLAALLLRQPELRYEAGLKFCCQIMIKVFGFCGLFHSPLNRQYLEQDLRILDIVRPVVSTLQAGPNNPQNAANSPCRNFNFWLLLSQEKSGTA